MTRRERLLLLAVGQWCQFYDNGWAVFHLHVAIITIFIPAHRHTDTHTHTHTDTHRHRHTQTQLLAPVLPQQCFPQREIAEMYACYANLSYLNLTLTLTLCVCVHGTCDM